MSDVRMNRIGTDYEFSNINDHHRNINEKNNYIDRPPPPSSPRKTNNKPFASPEDMYQQRNNINTGGGGGGGEVVYVAPPAQHHHQRQQPHRNGGGRPPPPPPRPSPPRNHNNNHDDDYDNRSYYSEAISERERQSRGSRRPAPPPPPHYRDQHDFNASLGSLDLDDSYRNTGSNNSRQHQQQSSRLHNSHPNFEYHHDHNDDNRSHYSEVSGGGRSHNSQQQQYSPHQRSPPRSSPHRNHQNDDHDDDRSHYSFGERQERRRASGFVPPAKPSSGVSRNKSDGYHNSFDNRGGDASGGERQQQQQTRSAEFAPPPSFRNNIKKNTDDSDNRSQYSKEAYSATGGKERNQRRQPTTDIFAPPPPRPIQNGCSANNSPGRTRQQQQQQRPYLSPPANSQHYGGGGSVGGGNSAGYLPPQHHQNDPIHDIMGAAGDFDNLEIQSYAGGGEGNRRGRRPTVGTNFDCGSTISSKAEYTLTGGDGSVVTGAASSRQQRIRDNYNTYQQQQQEQSQPQQSSMNNNARRHNGGGITQEGHKVIQKLKKEHGFPTGLATALYTNQNAFHHRIWIVDNSGSMVIGDGHAIPDGRRKRKGNKDGMITRWEELQETVLYHTQMASLLQSQTTFTLLNKPDQAGCPQTFTVADSKKKQCGFDFDEKEEIKYAESIISQVKPQGVTPLSQHIYNIHNTITKLTPELQRNGQRVAIILATDGLPTDDDGYGGNEITLEFINALKSLEGLPVWLVIRLCTDETKVTSFYNDLDQHLEFSLEVLDDFLGEAREVYKENKWLNYALPMHRCRELGYHDRLFDLIDERPLTKGELRDMVVLLFGSNGNNTTTIINSTTEEPNTSSTCNIPNPHTEWKEFLKYIQEQLKNEQEQYNPIKKKMMPWINLRTLHKIYGKDGNCTIQ